MTRKDYVLIAAALQQGLVDSRTLLPDAKIITHHMARALSSDNPRFDSQRFTTAVFGQKIDPATGKTLTRTVPISEELAITHTTGDR